VECMQRAADFDAKAPERRFADDSESKRRGASDRVRRLAEEWIAPAYLQLEIARHAGLAVPPEIP